MIRPYTIFCVLLAGASGLFLYSKKHETNVLDQNIRAIVRQTDDTRQETAMLQSQWALLNQPDRLQALSARFLTRLAPMTPEQYKKLETAIASLPAPGQKIPHENVMLADASQQPHAIAPKPVNRAADMLARKDTSPAMMHDAHTNLTADAALHHVVSDRPRARAQLALAAPHPMTHSVAPVARAHVDTHIRYATYHGARAVATPAVAWREARTNGATLRAHDHFYGRTTHNVSEGGHDTPSAFALASDSLPPPAPLGD